MLTLPCGVVVSFDVGFAHQPDALALDLGAADGDEAQHDDVADPPRAEAPAAAGMPFEGACLSSRIYL